jgi:hypothetical protein
MTLECIATGGHILWKIILKLETFAKLSPTNLLARTIPPRPFGYKNEDLLKAIRHMESIVRVTEVILSHITLGSVDFFPIRQIT